MCVSLRARVAVVEDWAMKGCTMLLLRVYYKRYVFGRVNRTVGTDDS